MDVFESLLVFETPPYEVTETGWGEFEIVIKIWFVDPTEKPVTLYHQLQLYHKGDLPGHPSKKPVISERYEEFVTKEWIRGADECILGF